MFYWGALGSSEGARSATVETLAMSILRLPCAALLLIVVACDDGGEAPAPPPKPAELRADEPKAEDPQPAPAGPPFEVVWKDTAFTVEGDPKRSGQALLLGAAYTIEFRGFPKGTKWSAGDLSGEITSGFEQAVVADVSALLGEVTLRDLAAVEAKVTPGEVVSLTQPDGSTGKLTLPPSLVLADLLFAGIAEGPVKFGDEGDEDPIPGRSIIDPGWTMAKWYGKAKKLSDLDAVAIRTRPEEFTETKTCKGYETGSGNEKVDLEVRLKQAEVVVYDRRKGGEIARKMFPPNTKCPSSAFVVERVVDSDVPEQEIDRWLRSLAK
jgi:hypothetical protein